MKRWVDGYTVSNNKTKHYIATSPVTKKKSSRTLGCYKDSYEKEWPCFGPSSVSINYAFCKICRAHFSVGHGGRNDCLRHTLTLRHKKSESRMPKDKIKPNGNIKDNIKPKDSIKRKSSIKRKDNMKSNFIMEPKDNINLIRKQGVSLSLKDKICVLERLKAGEGSTMIARSVNVTESTVRYIKKTEDKLRKRFAEVSSNYADKQCHAGDPIMIKMENSLVVWIEDSIKKQIALNPSMIQEKALQIYKLLQETTEFSSVKKEFCASGGWYKRFKGRFDLQDLKVPEENTSMAVVASDNNIPDELTKIIQSLGYSTDQILNPDETVLYWKQVPEIKHEFEAIEDKSDSTLTNEASHSTNIDSDLESTSSHELPDTTANFNFKTIKEGLKLAYKLECFFIGNDPSMSRSLKFKKELKKALAPYRAMYKEIQKNGH